MKELLHVYGQHFQHSPVVIVGDRAALTHLRDAIAETLDSNADEVVAASKTCYVCDGDGFVAYVFRISKYMDTNKTCVPYINDSARERRPDVTNIGGMIRDLLDKQASENKSSGSD